MQFYYKYNISPPCDPLLSLCIVVTKLLTPLHKAVSSFKCLFVMKKKNYSYLHITKKFISRHSLGLSRKPVQFDFRKIWIWILELLYSTYIFYSN